MSQDLFLSEMVYLLNGTLHEVYFLLVLFFPWGKSEKYNVNSHDIINVLFLRNFTSYILLKLRSFGTIKNFVGKLTMFLLHGGGEGGGGTKSFIGFSMLGEMNRYNFKG